MSECVGISVGNRCGQPNRVDVRLRLTDVHTRCRGRLRKVLSLIRFRRINRSRRAIQQSTVGHQRQSPLPAIHPSASESCQCDPAESARHSARKRLVCLVCCTLIEQAVRTREILVQITPAARGQRHRRAIVGFRSSCWKYRSSPIGLLRSVPLRYPHEESHVRRVVDARSDL